MVMVPPAGPMPQPGLYGPVVPAAPAAGGPSFHDVDCPLEALPRTGSVSGRIVDADGMGPVAGASLKLIDAQGKEVGVPVDNGGGFKVGGLPPGPVTLKAEATNYLTHLQPAEVKAMDDSQASVVMHKRPKKGEVEIAGNEIKIKRQIAFEIDSPKILTDSTGLLEEIADVINRNPRIKRIEIQGHTDNTGTREHNKTLSEQRANSVRDALVSLGVEPNRLVAVGYGQDRPVAPNATPQGRERNRRTQLMIVDQDKGGAALEKKGTGRVASCGKPNAAMPF